MDQGTGTLGGFLGTCLAVGSIIAGAGLAVARIKKRKNDEFAVEANKRRQETFRLRRKTEEAQRQQKVIEDNRLDEAIREKSAVIKRQQRARDKRLEPPYDYFCIDVELKWLVEDISMLYEFKTVRTSLEWIAWYLDPLYAERKDDPIPAVDQHNETMVILRKNKEVWCNEWYWSTCHILLTQRCKTGAINDGEITLLDGLLLALQHYKDNEFIVTHIVWIVCLIVSNIVNMDNGFVYEKEGFHITMTGEGERWNIFMNELTEGLLNTSANNSSSPREIAVAWKVSVLERIQREWVIYLVNFIAESKCFTMENLDIKIIAEETLSLMEQYLSVSRYYEVSEFQVQLTEQVDHLSKKHNSICGWNPSCSINTIEQDFPSEERGQFRRCVNAEQLKSRTVLKLKSKA